MPTDERVESIIALISAMDKVDVESPKGGASKSDEEIRFIADRAPAKELIEPLVPGFIDAINCTSINGCKVSFEELVEAWRDGENIHLVGPSGSGKSVLAKAIVDYANSEAIEYNRRVWERNKAFLKEFLEDVPDDSDDDLEMYRVLPYSISQYSCHQGTRSEDLIGNVTVKIDEEGNRIPIEVNGAVTRAWEGGKTLILEEFDLAPAGVLGELHLFLDGTSDSTTVYINGPRDIKKHPEFRCIATSNTRGAGEAAMEFAGTQPLNSAFMNRFGFTVEVTWLDPKQEEDLIVSKVPLKRSLVAKMISVSNKIRASYGEGLVDKPVSTRNLLAWARNTRRLMKVKGYSESLGDKELWREVVVPAAMPAFLNGFADETSADSILSILELV